MANKELFIAWAGDGIAHVEAGETYELWSGELFVFDTVLRTVSSSIYYQRVFSTPAQDTPPADYSRDIAELLVANVSGPSHFRYYHDGVGGVTITEQTLTLTAQVVGCRCFGDNTGAIDLTVGGGFAGPFTYLWDDGPTTEDRGVVPAGVYRVAVTDTPTGAIARVTVQVGSNPELEVLIQKAGGTVSLQVSGGVGPYSYLWSDGVTTRDRTGLATGPYTCTITDAPGCTKQIQVAVNTDQFYFSRNPIPLALDAGPAYRLNPATKPNLTFLCEVWIEKTYLSGAFERIGGVLEQPADRDGRTVFEVQALLDVFLAHHVPAVGSTGLERADPMFRRFYLKYAESFGATPVRAGTTVLTQNYVVLGGLNFHEARAQTFFDAYQPTVMPFLTWEPPVKAVLPDQPEYLYYMVTQSAVGFRFQLRVAYADGTSEVLSLGGADNVRLHEVYCRPVGYQALGLAELAGNLAVRWWEIFVTAPDGTTPLSEVRRFELDRRVFPRRRYLLFATSLGGMATFAATGEAQLDVGLSGEEAALSPTLGGDPLLGDTAVHTRLLVPVLKVASGKRTRAQMLAAQDLLLSRRVLLLDGPRWVPGFLKTKNTTLLDENKPVPTLEFDFYLTAERLFTPRLGSDQVTYAPGS